MRKTEIFILPLVSALVLSCSLFDSMKRAPDTAETKKAETINLPVNTKNSESELVVRIEDGCVLTLPNNEDILFGGAKLAADRIPGAIGDCAGRQALGVRRLFIKSDVSVDYGVIADIVVQARKQNIEIISFVVSPNDKPGEAKNVLEAGTRSEPKFGHGKVYKPNPYTLIVTLAGDGNLILNAEPKDSPESLTRSLTEIFRDRELTGVFREGTNEVEKTVFIKAPRSAKYGRVIELIDALAGSGANPINLQPDDLEN